MNENPRILARFPIQSGVMLGILPLPVHVFLDPIFSYQLAAITLVLIAGVYIGYAFKDGRTHVVLIELSIALLFAAAAWIGLNGLPYVILAALVFHGFWDVLHHSLIDTQIPRWYIPFCAVVDWIMAASLFVIWNLVG